MHCDMFPQVGKEGWSPIRQARNLFIQQIFIGCLPFQTPGMQLENKAGRIPILVSCWIFLSRPLRDQLSLKPSSLIYPPDI